MIRKVFFAIWLVATSSWLMAAEEMTDTEAARRTVVLDEILITGTPLKDNPDTPNMTVVIPLPLLQGPESTLDAALKRQPGIDIQRPQEVGAALDDNSIRIRGFGSNRIVATVDGRPLNSPGTAGGYFIRPVAQTLSINCVHHKMITK
jgi:outer membrane receptor for ferrienterochelin and colicin